jgi:hypothetical protein
MTTIPLRFTMIALLAATIVYAQSLAPAPAAKTGTSGDVPVQLSPFEVTADVKGYFSGNTMSGTRLNSKLEDIGAAITVMTKEQMADFAMLDINDIFLHSVGTEGSGDYTDFAVNNAGSVSDNVQNNPRGANRVRGIGSANLSFGNVGLSLAGMNWSREIGSAIGQVVSCDARDHDVRKTQSFRRLGDALRLVEFELLGLALGHRAEAAGPRTDVAENHECGGARRPAFEPVGALGRRAHGFEAELGDQVGCLRMAATGAEVLPQPRRQTAHRGSRRRRSIHRHDRQRERQAGWAIRHV